MKYLKIYVIMLDLSSTGYNFKIWVKHVMCYACMTMSGMIALRDEMVYPL